MTPPKPVSSQAITLGARIQVAGGESHNGALTVCVRASEGRLWIVSCAHVLALLSDPPVSGAAVTCAGQPIGSLSAWVELETGESFDSDVALAKPHAGLSLAPTWPDGLAFNQTGPMPATGSIVTVFSPLSPDGIQAHVAGPPKNVTLALPDGEPVTYLNQVPVCAVDGSIIADYRDSGSPVRDRNGLLVGMLIAKDNDGKTAFCTPWPSVQAQIDTLAASVL